ncbi:MAG: PAS domain S-box protein [Polyangiaceae bacterium]|nr:PAS domain S-box protein [Polyangiaceae bacterium]
MTWSDEIYDLFGLPRDTELGFDSIVTLIHPDDRAKNQAFVDRLLGGAQRSRLEFRLLLGDGTVKHILQHAEVHVDGNGSPELVLGTMQDVTEIQQARADLEQAQAVSHVGSWDYDVVGNRVTWTRETYRILGRPCDLGELTQEVRRRMVHPEDWPTLTAAAQRAVAEGTPFSIEFRIVLPDGATRWARTTCVVQRDASGRVTRLSGTVQDIHERKCMEQELRERTAFAESLVNTAHAIVLVLDPRGRIVTLNPYAETLSGYALREVKGREWFEIFLPVCLRATVRALFHKALGGTPTRGNVDVLLTRDGRERLVEWYDTTLRDEAGAVTGLLCVGQDVTERERAQKELLASEERFRLVFDSTTEGILLTDAETMRPILANHALCHMLGYTLEELTLVTVRDLHPPEALPEIETALARQFVGTRSYAEAIALKRRDGSTFAAELAATTVMHAGRPAFLATFRDVTEKRKLQASLAQADRLASMGMLAAGVAHEINNPLSYVLYNLESLAEDMARHAAEWARLRAALVRRSSDPEWRDLVGGDIEVLSPSAAADMEERFSDALSGARRIKEIARDAVSNTSSATGAARPGPSPSRQNWLKNFQTSSGPQLLEGWPPSGNGVWSPLKEQNSTG